MYSVNEANGLWAPRQSQFVSTGVYFDVFFYAEHENHH